MDILEKIVQKKRAAVEVAKHARPFEKVRDEASRYRERHEPHALKRALEQTDRINIIAEFKRCSPSKGMIRANADAWAIACAYESAGAVAISVLTEEYYFQGSLVDLRDVRNAVSLPVLRKDFIVEPYQIYESAAAGADGLLLIVASLDEEELAKLLKLTESLGVDALVEVHNPSEMETALAVGAKLIGVNNRDLRTFAVTAQTSIDLSSLAPADVVLVSESGLTPSEVVRLRASGYHGFLVGEALMCAEDPEYELSKFVSHEARAV
jgi:indole-3-glycerol phosphate synthase